MFPSGRFHSETNLWDPKATSDSEEISAAYGNLFAAAAMYATVAVAWIILTEELLEGRRKRDGEETEQRSRWRPIVLTRASYRLPHLLKFNHPHIRSTRSHKHKGWLVSGNRGSVLFNRLTTSATQRLRRCSSHGVLRA